MRVLALLFGFLTFPLSAQVRTVIVEFRGTPLALAQGEVSAAANRNTHARFRSDLARLSPAIEADGVERESRPAITREYSMTFFGAAVRADAEAIARIRALPYVAGVHDERAIEGHSIEAGRGGTRASAINLPTRGKGITIAIMDSGIDYHHPALRHAYGGGYDFINDDDDPFDDNGHGTVVAGAAVGNSADVIGVAPEATVVAYKVLKANLHGVDSAILAALERAADPNQDGNPADHVHVLNISLGFLGGSPDDILARAVDNTVAAGVVAVVSAGNAGTIGTIHTPATSRRAITVGSLDKAGNDVAFFSSRGPATGLLTFKPDIVAPGWDVVTSKRGGGTELASGTSLSAPYVSGAAALLLALHPDWTPERVKSALVQSATALPADAFARGAGKIDVVAAASTLLEVSETGLSFGGNGELTGTRTETRRFTIANRGTQRQTLALSATGSPGGCTVTVTPAALDLAAGQSAEVTVQLVTDNASMRPPSVAIIGGDIVVAGTSSLTIPWALVRGARAAATYDGAGVIHSAVAFGDRFRSGVMIDDRSFEFWLPANLTQDFVMATGDGPRLMTVERRITGDEVVSFKAADATLKIDLQDRDRDGTRLSELPRELGRREHFLRLRVTATGPNAFLQTAFAGARELLTTPVPSRLKIETAEVYVDVEGMRGYAVQHKPMNGIAANVTLTNEPYVHARLRWPASPAKPGTFTACYVLGDVTRNTFATEGCVNRSGDTSDLRFDLYTTPELNPDRYLALLFAGNGFETPPMRAANGAIVATAEATPSAATYRIAHEADVRVGGGPHFPTRFFGTGSIPATSVDPPRGFTGPLGEILFGATAGSSFVMRDASGAIVARGPLDAMSLSEPAVQPGHRLQVIAANLHVAGRLSRGQLDVLFGNEPDGLVAPTITSLQLLSAAGTPADILQRGEAATLRFAVADYVDQGSDVRARAVQARVSWRVAGTGEWRALPVTETGTEIGTRNTLKHLPSGSMMTADMRDATAVDNVAIDLRFEFEDVYGSQVTWTQEPAFIVGNPPLPPRRRAQ
jgi:subtilisin family serine protease